MAGRRGAVTDVRRQLFERSTVQRWKVDIAEYFADRFRVSRSMLELFRKGPALYEARYLGDGEDEDTDALRLGRALHVLTFQPDRAAELVVTDLEPEPDEFKGTGAKARREAFKARKEEWRKSLPAGAAVLTPELLDRATGMRDALQAKLAELLDRERAEFEVPLEWTDDESGLPCKAMVDWHYLTRARDAVLAFDLKSTSDPSPGSFTRSIVNLGYHRQAAMYSDALARLYGLPVKFYLIAVRSTRPHVVARPYEIDPALVDTGRRQIRRALADFASCRNANTWRAPWECADAERPRPYLLTAPRWALEEP